MSKLLINIIFIDGNLMVTNRLVKTIKQQLKQNKPDNCAFGRESPFPGIHVPSWKFNRRIPNIPCLQIKVPCPGPIMFTTRKKRLLLGVGSYIIVVCCCCCCWPSLSSLHHSNQRTTFVGCRPAGRGAGLPICAVGLSWAGATGSEIHLSESLCDLSMVGQSFKDIYPGYFYAVEGNLMVINPVVKKGWLAIVSKLLIDW